MKKIISRRFLASHNPAICIYSTIQLTPHICNVVIYFRAIVV